MYRKSLHFYVWIPLIAVLAVGTILWAQPENDGPPRPHNGQEERGERGFSEGRGGGPPRFMFPPKKDDRGGPWDRMTAEEARGVVDAAMEILEEIDPDAAQRVRFMAERNPHMVMEMLRRRFPRLEPILALREQNPDLFHLRMRDYKLNTRSFLLAREIRDAEGSMGDPEKLTDLEDQLRASVEEHFEVRQKIREFELASMEDEIERLTQEVTRLREEIEQRSVDPQGLIEQRIDTLLQRNQNAF